MVNASEDLDEHFGVNDSLHRKELRDESSPNFVDIVCSALICKSLIDVHEF